MIAPHHEFSTQMNSFSMYEETAEVGLATTDRPQRSRLKRKRGAGSMRPIASKGRAPLSSNAGASNETNRLSVEAEAGAISEARLYLAAMTHLLSGRG